MDLPYYSIVNDIRMTREVYRGAFVIAEGSTDMRIFEQVIDPSSCMLINGFGKSNVIAAIADLDKSGFEGAVGIVDSDFDRLEGMSYNSENIVMMDDHDAEMMMLKSPALDKVLAERCSRDKLESVCLRSKLDLRTILLRMAEPLGYWRWMSLNENLGVKFEEFDHSRIFTGNKWEVDESKLTQVMQSKLQKSHAEFLFLLSRLGDLRSQARDLWQVCCGHDVTAILCIGLSRAIGTSRNAVRAEDLERDLRLAYRLEYFQLTSIYNALLDWQQRARKFTVLR